MKIYCITSKKIFEVNFKRNIGEEATTCPVCSSDRKKKTVKSFSFNHDKETGNCMHCAATFVKHKDLMQAAKKEYVKPIYTNFTELTQDAVDWFFKRGISQHTLNRLQISTGVEFMPQIKKSVNTIRFPYLRDGEVVNIKYRSSGKNFKLAKDAELVFYNLDAIKGQKECIIVEGEIDVLSWIEAGENLVISVPNGASKKPNLDYLDNCYEYFEGMDRIIIATDNDEVGIILRNELARRIGLEKCFYIDFSDLKDSNEVLCQKGASALISLKNSLKSFPLEGVFTISDIWTDVIDIYENGLPTGDSTGDKGLDAKVAFMPGELTMVTGIPGHGKSIMLDQISLGLAINSNWKFAICSPESYPLAFYFTRLIKKLFGRKFSKNNILKSELLAAKEWLQDRYNMILPDAGFDLDSILAAARQLVVRKGVKGLIIDPWNRIEAKIPNGYSEGKWVGEQLSKIISFAQITGVHVFLVAHPTKMQKDSTGVNYIVPTLYNISGSANFYNMTQNGLCIFRNYQTNQTELHIQKVKWEHLGEIGRVDYVYNTENTRFDYPGCNGGNWIEHVVKLQEAPQIQWPKIVAPLRDFSEMDQNEIIPF